jgi:hypothetical protein
LADLSKNISIGKGRDVNGRTFGGINVVLCGDFHHFPPVAGGPQEALYAASQPGVDTQEQLVGREIYEEFSTVVILKEQMRIIDSGCKKMLSRLQYGRVQKDDIDLLHKLVISNKECPPVNFEDEEWRKASLVTPRHGVRRAWNDAAIAKTGHCMFIYRAEDSIKGRPLTLPEQYGLALRSSQRTITGRKRNTKQDLPETLTLAIGARVMVVQNIETDLDLANGARGTIVDIILHPDEPPISDDQSVVHLQHLPAYILVELERTWISKLDGLEEGVIPIRPRQRAMRISVQQRKGPAATQTVKRMQYPLTLAYAFTDYRSQGQTIVPVVMDIATPPGRTLTLFNIYMSRFHEVQEGTQSDCCGNLTKGFSCKDIHRSY